MNVKKLIADLEEAKSYYRSKDTDIVPTHGIINGLELAIQYIKLQDGQNPYSEGDVPIWEDVV